MAQVDAVEPHEAARLARVKHNKNVAAHHTESVRTLQKWVRRSRTLGSERYLRSLDSERALEATPDLGDGEEEPVSFFATAPAASPHRRDSSSTRLPPLKALQPRSPLDHAPRSPLPDLRRLVSASGSNLTSSGSSTPRATLSRSPDSNPMPFRQAQL